FLGKEFSFVGVMPALWVARDYVLQKHRDYTREAVSCGLKEIAHCLEHHESVLKTQSVSPYYA
ncbi:hypothetical protein BKA93DRAFT_700370, partial [Sparassis latifolia]